MSSALLHKAGARVRAAREALDDADDQLAKLQRRNLAVLDEDPYADTSVTDDQMRAVADIVVLATIAFNRALKLFYEAWASSQKMQPYGREHTAELLESSLRLVSGGK
jgi:hypothetical protein